jgi:hypothetical protein
MNADIPYLHCWVRNSFISRSGGMEEAYAFAVQSFPGRALAFHCMLRSGAHYRGVPIHALATRPISRVRSLGDCQLWDCFSYRPIVTVFHYLQGHEAICYTQSGEIGGSYLFTIDWLPDGPAGWTTVPEQNKCGHVLALADGNLACLPTNRIAWRDGYFVGQTPDPRSRGYKVQAEVYQSEHSGADASSSEDYCYSPSWPARSPELTSGDDPYSRDPKVP